MAHTSEMNTKLEQFTVKSNDSDAKIVEYQKIIDEMTVERDSLVIESARAATEFQQRIDEGNGHSETLKNDLEAAFKRESSYLDQIDTLKQELHEANKTKSTQQKSIQDNIQAVKELETQHEREMDNLGRELTQLKINFAQEIEDKLRQSDSTITELQEKNRKLEDELSVKDQMLENIRKEREAELLQREKIIEMNRKERDFELSQREELMSHRIDGIAHSNVDFKMDDAFPLSQSMTTKRGPSLVVEDVKPEPMDQNSPILSVDRDNDVEMDDDVTSMVSSTTDLVYVNLDDMRKPPHQVSQTGAKNLKTSIVSYRPSIVHNEAAPTTPLFRKCRPSPMVKSSPMHKTPASALGFGTFIDRTPTTPQGRDDNQQSIPIQQKMSRTPATTAQIQEKTFSKSPISSRQKTPTNVRQKISGTTVSADRPKTPAPQTTSKTPVAPPRPKMSRPSTPLTRPISTTKVKPQVSSTTSLPKSSAERSPKPSPKSSPNSGNRFRPAAENFIPPDPPKMMQKSQKRVKSTTMTRDEKGAEPVAAVGSKSANVRSTKKKSPAGGKSQKKPVSESGKEKSNIISWFDEY